MAKVSLKNVTYSDSSPGGKERIKDLSLEIPDRELTVLVGAPRCGITSIIRMIAGLDRPSSGEIFIGDRCVNEVQPNDRDVALVPAQYVPYPRMSVNEHLVLGPTLRKRPKAETDKRAATAAELIGLKEVLQNQPASLNAEQRQRLAIARAIALNPQVFLFDEVLLGLDAKARQEIQHDIVRLHHRLQVTMIYGTHDPVEAMAMEGQMIVLNDGRLEQAGPGKSLYAEPANAFVGEFVGAMNLLEGTLKQEQGSWVFVERDQGTVKVRLSATKLTGGSEIAGGPIVLGVRPEDIIEQEQSTNAPEKGIDKFAAIIDFVEPIGGEAKLYLQTGAHKIVSRSKRSADSPEAGHRSRFTINAERLCLFDPATGRKIS